MSGALWRRNMGDVFQSGFMVARHDIRCMQNNDDKRASRILSGCKHRGFWSTTKVLNDTRNILPAQTPVDETGGTL